jgi:uncharacterized protein (TIGR03089 family)
MRTLDQLLGTARDPSQPFITYYDLATGERVELSTITTANWVAKTSNFLVDELDAEPGTRLRIGLPTHWQTAVWILSAWNVGAVVVDHDAAIGLSGPDLLADEPHRLAASLRPLGGRFVAPPEGFLDIGAEVPGHGDHFLAVRSPEASTPALDLDGVFRTHADVLGSATPSSARLVVEPGPLSRDAELLVSAALGGGSLVLVAAGSPDGIDRVTAQEGGERA